MDYSDYSRSPLYQDLDVSKFHKFLIRVYYGYIWLKSSGDTRTRTRKARASLGMPYKETPRAEEEVRLLYIHVVFLEHHFISEVPLLFPGSQYGVNSTSGCCASLKIVNQPGFP